MNCYSSKMRTVDCRVHETEVNRNFCFRPTCLFAYLMSTRTKVTVRSFCN